jgi:hypothetical protein
MLNYQRVSGENRDFTGGNWDVIDENWDKFHEK